METLTERRCAGTGTPRPPAGWPETPVPNRTEGPLLTVCNRQELAETGTLGPLSAAAEAVHPAGRRHRIERRKSPKRFYYCDPGSEPGRDLMNGNRNYR